VDDIGIAKGRGGGARDDQYVARRRQRGAVAAKELAHQTADAVARRGTADLAARGDAEAGGRSLRLACDHDEVRKADPPSVALQRQVLMALAQPEAGRKVLAAFAGRTQDGCLGGIETVNRLRPLARRRLITCCPPGVAMRARNPCVRFRRLLLG